MPQLFLKVGKLPNKQQLLLNLAYIILCGPVSRLINIHDNNMILKIHLHYQYKIEIITQELIYDLHLMRDNYNTIQCTVGPA